MPQIIGILLALVMTGVLIIHIRRLRRLKDKNLRLQEEIAQAEHFFERVKEQADSIRRYRHDLKKHIRIVEEFLKEEKRYESLDEYQELSSQLSRMQKDIDRNRSDRYCSDEVLNAICMIESEDCARKGITFTPEIECYDIDWVDDFHLTGILMNLLDNAVEAQDYLDPGQSKLVYLLARQPEGKNILEIQVGNRISSGARPDFKTRKEDKENHGIGMEIARRYAKIYHGRLVPQLLESSSILEVSTVLKPVSADGV